MKKIRRTIYLSEENEHRQELLRQALEEEHLLLSSTLSEAITGWFRLIIEAGLRTLTEEVSAYRA